MQVRFGAFGKIPALGDFFRHALPRSFVEPWDQWLQNAIVTTREMLGDNWNDCYLSAPIWRFSLPAGQAGPQGISGVLMASVDRVGRQFPLTLAAPVEITHVAAHHFANSTAFENLEILALSALDDSMTRERLVKGLEDIEYRDADPVVVNTHPGGQVWRSSFSPVPMQATQANDGHAGYWSASLGDDHRIMRCDQLPNANQTCGLFDLDAPIWSDPVLERTQ